MPQRSIITSLKNPLVKQLRKLHSAKYRHRDGLLLLEGTNLVEASLQTNVVLEDIFFTQEWQGRYPELWQAALDCAQRAHIVDHKVISAMATTVNPDGVIATAQRDFLHTPTTSQTQITLGVAIERLQDPGNLGTIIRTATAVGVDGLWLSEDSVDWDHPKVLRASVGEWFKIPKAVSNNLVDLVTKMQSQGIQVVATLPQAELTYWDVDLTKPSLILLGNEGAGLSEDLAAVADKKVKIPVQPGVESLNVAIAAALILYEAKRQNSYGERENRE